MIAAWSLEALDLSEEGLRLLFGGFLALWTIALGASIGSFLNVIIYRMPRGVSLVRPKSRCPACEAPIRPTDNIPLLGWLRVGGRCRSCGAAISARYPIVEGLIAILLFGLAWCEVYAGGINLPGSHSDHLVTNPLLWRIDPTRIIRMAYHACLVVVAVAGGYIAWDGFPPPRRLVMLSVLIGTCVPIFLPAVWPVESDLPRWLPEIVIGREPAMTVDASSLVVAAAGLLGGLLAGSILAIAALRRSDIAGTLFLTSLAGLFLGWQALLTYAPIAGIFALFAAGISRSKPDPIPATVSCTAALVVQVFAWRWLAGTVEDLGQQFHSIAALLAPLAVTIISLMLAGLARIVALTTSARPVETPNP